LIRSDPMNEKERTEMTPKEEISTEMVLIEAVSVNFSEA